MSDKYSYITDIKWLGLRQLFIIYTLPLYPQAVPAA